VSDSSQTIQRVIFERLKEAFAGSRVRIHDHTPSGEIDVRHPVILIGEGSAQGASAKGGTMARHLIEVTIIGAAQGRASINEAAGLALAALRVGNGNSWRPSVAGWVLLGPIFDSRDDREIEPGDVPAFATTLRFVVHSEAI
jgi:hypothetical protein